MSTRIGIRREDKNEWERRVPLVPADLAALKRDHDLEFIVQPSPIRVFRDQEYVEAGAVVQEDLQDVDILLAVKEIPLDLLAAKKTYLFFSHTIKGQAYNMPLLQRLLDLKATLIDYERITDEQNRRLIFFSLHAGYAGTIETLRAWGLRLRHEGVDTPLADIKPAYEYADLDDAKEHMRQIGARISAEGLGDHTRTVIIGIAGYGNVSRGCQELLDCLPVTEIQVEDLEQVAADESGAGMPLAKVVFHEEDMVEPRADEAQFVLQDYYQHPENYRGVFSRYLPRLTVLMNCIYWTERYPRLLTRQDLRRLWAAGATPALRIIGDVSCDVEGAVECTLKCTSPDDPVYVYRVDADDVVSGVEGRGPVVLAVDNLPCELPAEATRHFGDQLLRFVPSVARCDWDQPLARLEVPEEIRRAVIVHRGALAPAYGYLEDALERHAAGRNP